MEKKVACQICRSELADSSCNICGKLVCNKCLAAAGICVDCKTGKKY